MHGVRTEADRLILADIYSRVLPAAQSSNRIHQVTPEQFVLLQLNSGQRISVTCWMVVSKEATTSIQYMLDVALREVLLHKRMRLAIGEAQLEVYRTTHSVL
jgi:hypothetical protein